jgi:hypothetical protein
MFPEIATALASLKTISDLATLTLKVKVDSAVTEKAIESQTAIITLQNTIMGLQSQYQELLGQNDELKKRLIEIENWEIESKKYALTEIAEGIFVYSLITDQKNGVPPHWLCPNCYQNKKKSILQFQYSRTAHNNTFKCAQCDLQLVDHTNNAMPR